VCPDKSDYRDAADHLQANTANRRGDMTDDGIFLRNAWYVAAWNHELIDGKKLARTILERPIVLYRGSSGKVVALDDRCCHRAAPLSMGRIEGDDIRCMYHGMKFDAAGKCIQIPGQDIIPAKLGVRSYPVVERYNLIFIWIGDAEKADPNLIVDYPPLADPKWRGLPGYMHYKANWLLIVDNLSDFAHLAFVHTHTLGGSEEYAYKTKPVAIEKLDDGFRVERWHMSADPPPYLCKVISNKTDKVDRRNIGRMLIPGIFLLDTMFAPAGQGAEKGVVVPGTRQFRNAQFMTPDRRTSSGTTCTISTSTIRTSRCRCVTAWKRHSTRTRTSSRRSKRYSTPIRTTSC
jgi:phenylpropionate dioxygenase-like ring-hydroxylating dioxygenase large terminal subunit